MFSIALALCSQCSVVFFILFLFDSITFIHLATLAALRFWCALYHSSLFLSFSLLQHIVLWSLCEDNFVDAVWYVLNSRQNALRPRCSLEISFNGGYIVWHYIENLPCKRHQTLCEYMLKASKNFKTTATIHRRNKKKRTLKMLKTSVAYNSVYFGLF